MFQTVILVGRVGRSEGKEFPTSYLLKFSVVTNLHFVSKDGEKQERSTWHNCIMWGKRAKTLEPLITKGVLLTVQGMFEVRKWKDKDGNEKSEPQIVVNQLEILSRPAKPAAQDTAGEENQEQPEFGDDESIPF